MREGEMMVGGGGEDTGGKNEDGESKNNRGVRKM